MVSENPYKPPKDSPRMVALSDVRRPIAMLAFDFYGEFTNAWYAITFGLYFFVFGDNSSLLGIYALPLAAIVAAFLT